MEMFVHSWLYTSEFFLKLEIFSGKICSVKQNMFYVKYFFSRNHAFNEIM
jgi:hypothetical protein